MKTKGKRLMAAPMLCLGLSLIYAPVAQAGIWSETKTIVCDVQVQVQDNGGTWRWATVSGIMKECSPSFLSFCQVAGCAPLPFPQR